MKFTLVHKSRRAISGENYTETTRRFGDGSPVETIEDAIDWGKDVIDFYNESLRRGEVSRELITCIEGHHAREINRADDKEAKLQELLKAQKIG